MGKASIQGFSLGYQYSGANSLTPPLANAQGKYDKGRRNAACLAKMGHENSEYSMGVQDLTYLLQS